VNHDDVDHGVKDSFVLGLSYIHDARVRGEMEVELHDGSHLLPILAQMMSLG
jgi:hypothetical protein